MNKTVVIKKQNTMGGYDYLEFNQNTMEYATGNSGYHEGHGDYLVMIEAKTMKELKEKEYQFKNMGFNEIKTFNTQKDNNND